MHKTLLSISFSLATFCYANNAFAAPGTLPDAPLFLSNSAEANVFYTVDDSGSMEWEMLVEDGTGGFSVTSGIPTMYDEHGNMVIYPISYVSPVPTNGQEDYGGTYNYYFTTLPSVASYPETWVLHTSAGNKLYYNPEIDYVPWDGTDSSGTALYDNADPENALIDPNLSSQGTYDLTVNHSFVYYDAGSYSWVSQTVFPAIYYEWTDDNGNGVTDQSDTHTLIEIKSANAPFPSGRSYDEEIQNFANWYQYYRKRSFVAKAAIGSVVFNSGAVRMGVDTFNDGHQSDATSMSEFINKSSLLETVYDLGMYCDSGTAPTAYPNTCSGTPARNSLNRVGELFSGLSTNPSPIQSAADGGECQHNFNILITDGYWNGSEPSGIGNADKDDDTDWDGDEFADDYSVTLADIAMHYYEHDLSTTLGNYVPVISGVDENTTQHLVTYTVGFGVKGTLDPDSDDPTDGTFNWPDAINNTEEERVDDLWHAAYNGRGEYLTAQNPVELQNALLSVIDDIDARSAISAAVAVNSAQLTTDTIVYLAYFDTDQWEGYLYAYKIADTNTGEFADSPQWEAGELLDDMDYASRTILTYDGSDGVAFQWDTSVLSPEMVADLKANASGGTDTDSEAEAKLNYLRGDRSNENTGFQFRARNRVLGDLVNSGPVYVGTPSLSWPDIEPFPTSDTYSDFQAREENREGIVYLGSNDGMLHAFKDDDGTELFAYVPNFLASSDATEGYHYLSEQSYSHNFYVDLTPTISDVDISTNAGSGWRTVLIGAVRGGGRGLFALDITDPDDFTDESTAGSNVIWEFSSDDDADLGYTYSRPVVAYTNNDQWVAVFGNGYNDTGDGKAKLFILYIEKGLDGWGPADYVEISTEVGSATDKNGLASPALVDIDGDGTVDRVYAGDLQGNMWAFDLSDSNPTKWDVAYKSGSTPAPLFTAAASQPITAKPVVAKHLTIPDDNNNDPNLLVFFGTGQFLVDTDKTDTSVQSFYGVWDKGDSSLSRSNLIEQTFDSTYTDRVLTRNFVDYSTDYGWWFDLPDSGERAVTSPIARTDVVFFNSFVPETDPCSVGGYGYRFSVDMVTGGSPEEAVVDTNDDYVIDEGDNSDNGDGVIVSVRQDGYLPEPVFIEDLVFTGDVAEKIKKQPNLETGRFSWQELIRQ